MYTSTSGQSHFGDQLDFPAIMAMQLNPNDSPRNLHGPFDDTGRAKPPNFSSKNNQSSIIILVAIYPPFLVDF